MTESEDSVDSADDVPDPHADQPIVTAGAPAAAAEAGLVLLHGRGATAQGVINLFEPAIRRRVAVFAPQAARGRWFPRSFNAALAENEPDLSSGVARVAAAVDRAAAIGLPAERVVVAGFSQGACLAAEFAVRRPDRYGGIAVLSGALPGPSDRVPSETGSGNLAGTPVFLGCGADDPHVDRDRLDATVRTFERLEAEVTRRVYPGLGHAVTDDEFDEVGTLLDDALGRANE